MKRPFAKKLELSTYSPEGLDQADLVAAWHVLRDELSGPDDGTREDAGARLRELLSQIPPVEADAVECHLITGMSQMDLARVFRCSQPTIHCRVFRGLVKLKFLATLPEPTEEDLAILDGLPAGSSSVVRLYMQTYSQAETVRRLQASTDGTWTQGRVRHRLLVSLRKLQAAHPGHAVTVRLAALLGDNPMQYVPQPMKYVVD